MGRECRPGGKNTRCGVLRGDRMSQPDPAVGDPPSAARAVTARRDNVCSQLDCAWSPLVADGRPLAHQSSHTLTSVLLYETMIPRGPGLLLPRSVCYL